MHDDSESVTAVADAGTKEPPRPFRSLEEAQGAHDHAVETNRDLGIVPYKSGEKQSDKIFEVTEGYKHLPGGKVLGVGQRFHPTMRQVKTNALRGKARELTRSEARSAVQTSVPGDIGVRAVPGLTKKLAAYAIKHGLQEEDFAGVDPEGADDTFTKAQLNALIRAKRADAETDDDE